MNCTPNPKVQTQRLIARFAGEASSSLRLEHGADWSTDNKLLVRDEQPIGRGQTYGKTTGVLRTYKPCSAARQRAIAFRTAHILASRRA
jgi:hypothetical protein